MGGAPPGFSPETTIRRDRQGRWFHDGEPVTNPAVSQAFDRWIDRAEDGRYILRNAVNWVYVELEGPPIFVRRVEPTAQALYLHLSDGTREALDPRTLSTASDGRLCCRVRGARLDAELSRVAQLQLEPLVAEDELGLYLAIGGQRVRPG